MSSYMRYKPEWIREDFVDFIAEKIHPTWAWKRVKAVVLNHDALSDDFFKIQIRPNQNFKSPLVKAGQYVLVTLVINGIRQQRAYSIIEISKDGDLTIAVRTQGLVSQELAKMCVGDVLEISQSQGEFELKHEQKQILLIASGSGITAIYSLLKEALRHNFEEIDLIYFTRDDAFHVELEALSKQYKNFTYHHFNTLVNKQHLTKVLLEEKIPLFKQRMTYACGTKEMMLHLQKLYQDLEISNQLKKEYFQVHVDDSLEPQPVIFLRAQQEFEAEGNLLEGAEKAGLKPTHGCRMGVCNTCTCTKVSGSTKNMLTGEINHEPNSQIKLCISQAISPVVINL